MKEPQDDECCWKREFQSAARRVSEWAQGREAKEVLEVRREGAYDKRRWDEPRSSKGQRSGCMGKSEGHSYIIDDVAPRAVTLAAL